MLKRRRNQPVILAVSSGGGHWIQPSALPAHPRPGILVLVSALLFLGGALFWSIHSLPSLMLSLKSAFENRFPPTVLDAQRDITGIISLGGGVARVKETGRISALFPRARIVVTGPGKEEVRMARSQKFGSRQVIIEPNAADTFENALFTKELVNPKPGEQWIVVTSALHMPRAMGVFSALGFSVEPWPVFDAANDALEFWPALWHELLGLLAFRVLGHTTEFFPGPLDKIALSPKSATAPKYLGNAPTA